LLDLDGPGERVESGVGEGNIPTDRAVDLVPAVVLEWTEGREDAGLLAPYCGRDATLAADESASEVSAAGLLDLLVPLDTDDRFADSGMTDLLTGTNLE
jgi:hypothetical protein